MKRILISLFVVSILGLSTSCFKDRTCQCVDTEGGTVTDTYEIPSNIKCKRWDVEVGDSKTVCEEI